jgi:hypothetical protein
MPTMKGWWPILERRRSLMWRQIQRKCRPKRSIGRSTRHVPQWNLSEDWEGGIGAESGRSAPPEAKGTDMGKLWIPGEIGLACRGTTRRAKVARRKGNVVGKTRTRDLVRGTLKRRTFGRRRQPWRAALRREQWEREERKEKEGINEPQEDVTIRNLRKKGSAIHL